MGWLIEPHLVFEVQSELACMFTFSTEYFTLAVRQPIPLFARQMYLYFMYLFPSGGNNKVTVGSPSMLEK